MKTLIDKSNLLFINFFMAQRELLELKNKENIEKEDYPFILHTILNSLQYLFANNDNIIFCDEGKNSTKWRKEIYPDYKANRAEFKASLSYEHFNNIKPIVEEVLQYFPCKIVSVENTEGDDVIFALAEKYRDVKIISTDKDLIQIINIIEEASLFNPIKKKFAEKNLYIIEEKAIIGDKGDNIPGIPGIGEKTFQRMLTDTEFYNKKMANGNREIYERFLKIIDLSQCPFIQNIKNYEETISFNTFDSDSILDFFMRNKLTDLMLRWPSIKSKIDNKLNGGN